MTAIRSFATILLLALAACATSHRNVPMEIIPTQPTPTKIQPNPTSVKAATFFTAGSTMDEVAAIMGTPQTINSFGTEVWWYYGYSKIVFKAGRVTEWNNVANNLKVKWSSASASEDVGLRASAQQSVTSGYPVPSSSPVVPSADARKIDAQVATILAGEHSPLPPSQQIRTDTKSQVAEMITKNNTEGS